MEQAQILNQVIGKSLTEVDSEFRNDYVHTFIPTRSLRAQMQTTVSNIMVVAAAPKEGDSGKFLMHD